MIQCEGILEVKDWKHQTRELSQRNNQGDSQRGALWRQNIYAADADVLRDDVSGEIGPELRDLYVWIKWNQRSCTGRSEYYEYSFVIT